MPDQEMPTRYRSDLHQKLQRPAEAKDYVRGLSKGIRAYNNSAIQVQKAIVVRDSDLHDPLRSERELEELLRASGFRPSFGVHFHATKRMLESLLLADEHAIGKVAQRRGKEAQRCVPVSGVLEQLSDAKRILWERLSEAKLPADKKVFAEIAEASDLAKIIERCSHFRDFVKKANEC